MLSGFRPGEAAAHIRRLGDLLIHGVQRRGYRVASPRDGDVWSGIISFHSPVHDHHAIARKLREDHRVELAVRAGRLRCSPHFYNTEEQIARLVELLPGH
jgi:selenocysteine lyase/cysteine desulfurase